MNNSNISQERIKKLDEHVINRIAAGEVIQRPSSAIKELLENCLDAGSKHMKIVLKSGGLELLQISDDGCGIARGDLPILCERFTTSKLKTFDDLTNIGTFGFRGEALASISHVAHIRVVSRTIDSPCAYSVQYENCCMLEEPIAVAGLVGTTITVENLFYNLPTRRKALQSADEQQRILDVVGRYAVEYGDRGISFTVKKHGKTAPELHVISCSNSFAQGSLAAIRTVYGSELARELLPLNCSDLTLPGLTNGSRDSTITLMVRGLISRSNQVLSRRSAGLLLFINGRLVDCPGIRKAVEAVYQPLLPTQAKPFVYLSLNLPSYSLDVNVHPTKREVTFLHEQAVVSAVHDKILSTLQAAPGSRAFEIHSLTGLSNNSNLARENHEEEEVKMTKSELPTPSSSAEQLFQNRAATRSLLEANEAQINQMSKKRLLIEEVGRSTSANGRYSNTSQPAPNKVLRTEIGSRNLQAYFPAKTGTPVQSLTSGCECCGQVNASLCQECTVSRPVAVSSVATASLAAFDFTSTNLSSGRTMIEELQFRHSDSLVRAFKELDFVGIVDRDHSLAQCGTALMILNHSRLLAELCRQLCILQFGEMEEQHIMESSNGLSLQEIMHLALTSVKKPVNMLSNEDISLPNAAVAVLIRNREMLQKYFRIGITLDGRLISLPVLLRGIQPCPERLPMFIFTLATETDWRNELDCFSHISQCVGSLFGRLTSSEESFQLSSLDLSLLQHALYPAFRRYLLPSDDLKTSMIEVSRLEQLYKIFERC